MTPVHQFDTLFQRLPLVAILRGLTPAEAPAAPYSSVLPQAVQQGPYSFFESTAINKDDLGVGVWMIESDENGQPKHLTGFSPLELWSIDVGPRARAGAWR